MSTGETGLKIYAMSKVLIQNQSYIALLVLVLAMFCTSCEKEVPLGTLTASVDGNKRIFDGDPKAEWTSDPEGYELWIHGVGLLNEVSIRILHSIIRHHESRAHILPDQMSDY